MIIDEEIDFQGRSIALHLSAQGEHFELRSETEILGPVSAAILERVVLRYARPMEEEPALTGESLDLGAGRALHRYLHRIPVDLESKLYLVLTGPEIEPSAVLARQVANALRFLLTPQSSS